MLLQSAEKEGRDEQTVAFVVVVVFFDEEQKEFE